MEERETAVWVLDTNTVMALWVFEDPALLALKMVLNGPQVLLASRADAIEELRRVLAYRQFAVPEARQAEILVQYSARCAGVPLTSDTPLPLPRCRDPDDQKFLEIARDSCASHLVTRDKLLLKLARHRLIRTRYRILTPEALQMELKHALPVPGAKQ